MEARIEQAQDQERHLSGKTLLKSSVKSQAQIYTASANPVQIDDSTAKAIEEELQKGKAQVTIPSVSSQPTLPTLNTLNRQESQGTLNSRKQKRPQSATRKTVPARPTHQNNT
jgi:hypothetical protein